MAKRRLSMADEFLNKTEEFLDFVGASAQDAALEPEIEHPAPNPPAGDRTPSGEHIMAIAQIQLPSRQPRRFFDPQAMESLVASIREHGILQPLLVRPSELSDRYELVAGERRYRAAKILGLEEVPVVIRDLSNQHAVQVALLENLQREDLNPVEETEAMLELLRMNLECSKEEVVSLLNQVAHIKKQGGELTNNVIRSQWETVERVFKVVGRLTPDSFRSNRLPLLNLPNDILDALRMGQIEYTKARAIAQLKEESQRQELLEKVIQEDLSVRDIREQVRAAKPERQKNSLLERVKVAYQKMKEDRLWEDPSKRKTLEKLIGQLEEIIG